MEDSHIEAADSEDDKSIIRGFDVLTLSYPNHVDVEADFTAEQLATAVSGRMDENWFRTHFGSSRFSVSDVYEGRGDHIGSFGFDFSIDDQSGNDPVGTHTAVVRETAGGGFMLLLERTAKATFGAALTELFEQETESEASVPGVS